MLFGAAGSKAGKHGRAIDALAPMDGPLQVKITNVRGEIVHESLVERVPNLNGGPLGDVLVLTFALKQP